MLTVMPAFGRYPAIMLGCWALDVAKFVYVAVTGQMEPMPLGLASLVLFSCQVLAAAVCYLLNDLILHAF
jgi:hypothetical protein